MDSKNHEDANRFNSVGNLFKKSGKYVQAVRAYRDAILCNPSFTNAKFNLAGSLHALSQQETDKAIARTYAKQAERYYERVVREAPWFCEAWSNLGALFMKEDRLADSFVCLEKAVRLQDLNRIVLPEAFWNLNCVLRRLGKKEQSLQRTLGFLKANSKHPKNKFDPIILQSTRIERCRIRHVNFVCIKWGTKYGPEYVLRLYQGVRKNVSKITFDFHCFTDKKKVLENVSGIKLWPLNTKLKGWWTKAFLFSSEHYVDANTLAKFRGRIVYIDLDTIITGNLDDICSYNGKFALLSTKGLDNEGVDYQDGYNSSLILWDSSHFQFFRRVFEDLSENFQIIHKFIHRFDHWLELIIRNPDYLQNLYPGKVLEFKNSCSKGLPASASVVVFPLSPKPHECLKIPWVSSNWTD